MERSFKSESFVHPQKRKAVHILPCNFTLQNKTSYRQCYRLKWSHFDDHSVKGINNDPKTHCLSQGGLSPPAKLALHWQHPPCAGTLQEGWLSHPGHCLSQAALTRLQAQLQHRAAQQTSCREYCRARPGMDQDGSSYVRQQAGRSSNRACYRTDDFFLTETRVSAFLETSLPLFTPQKKPFFPELTGFG